MHADLPPTAAATIEFLQRQLGSTRRRVLEIGCGQGTVAAALGRLGHEVLALDADPEMVAAARGRGVDARCVRWPEFEGSGYDAVVFVHSLHHVEKLDTALDRAAAVLVPHGSLLLDEFALEAVDERTARWFVKALREIDGDGLLRNEPRLLANRMLHADDPLAVWRDEHDGDLHPFAAIEVAVSARFRPALRADAAYLFRYVAAAAVASADGTAAVQRLLREEERLLRRGDIAAVGRRLAARAPLAG